MPPELRRDTVKLGDLLSIAEQIQTFGLGRKTGEICIVNAPPPARISIVAGEVVDAQFGLLSGVEAAKVLINLPSPESEFAVGDEPKRRTIEMPYMQLLFEAALARDQGAFEKELPPVEPSDPAPGDPHLRISLGSGVVAFSIRPGITGIGRAMANDIVISDPTVSQVHAAIEYSEEGILLRDLGSSNGTYFEAQRIKERWLKTQDRLRFGSVHCLFVDGIQKTSSAA